MKNEKSVIILCISYTVNLESIKTVCKETIYMYIFFWKSHMSKL